ASFFFSSRSRHTRCYRDWSSDVCSSDLSSLLLVPLVHRMLPPGGRVGVMTVNAGTLTPEHLTSAGIGAEVPLAVAGMETEKEFRSEERRVGKEWGGRSGARKAGEGRATG